MGTRTPLTWSVLIPVKELAQAKSRLSGLGDADREALALAMAADTVAAAVGCGPVGAVVVVTGDPAVRAEAGALGAEVLAGQPPAGLNQALLAGAAYARQRWPGRGLAALTADLPALAASELAAALAAASSITQSFVADAAGSGTTLYMAGPGAEFRPRFGPASRQRHRQNGAAELDLPGIRGLRQDVDTMSDLRSAARIGLGPQSAAVEKALGERGALRECVRDECRAAR
ncbi:MAG TPA: 2-phospho-L-lactate guanylyltransferase [Streptosporangiaceae bacterium]|nr:2-phospho-L-lactate guanylyltransferase [Streptosporangiaceae bacterium]